MLRMALLQWVPVLFCAVAFQGSRAMGAQAACDEMLFQARLLELDLENRLLRGGENGDGDGDGFTRTVGDSGAKERITSGAAGNEDREGSYQGKEREGSHQDTFVAVCGSPTGPRDRMEDGDGDRPDTDADTRPGAIREGSAPSSSSSAFPQGDLGRGSLQSLREMQLRSALLAQEGVL